MNDKNDIEKIWGETPNSGILPKGIQKRMWHHIAKKTFKKKPMVTYISIAAVFLLFVLSSVAIYLNLEHPIQNEKILAVKTYSQDIRLLKLPDGSRVWLNEGSEISYPEKFKENERLVELKGEAFFDIERDTTRPFKIKSGKFTTTVLGTSFNIQAYDEKSPKVSVVSGKVRVEKINPSQVNNKEKKKGQTINKIELVKGEATIYKEEKQNFAKLSFTNQEEIVWRKSLLDIDDKPLGEVIEKLQKVYRVKIVYQDSGRSKDYVLKGTLDTRQSLHSSLKVISFAVEEIEFQQKSDSVWWVKKIKP